MESGEPDEIDRAILTVLQEDARNNTNATISDRVGVSASTVGKRIKRMERAGVITGYRPTIDYERAGYPLDVLFRCTAAVSQRSGLIERLRTLDGVVDIRELMTGSQNVQIRAVGASKDDITRLARSIDECGLEIVDEVLIRSESTDQSIRPGRVADTDS